MPTNDDKALCGPWQDLWNGDPAVADEIIAPVFVAHFAPAGNSPGEVRGPEELKRWVGASSAAFADHRFTGTVGPIADGDMVAVRWVFRARYAGGIAGASPDRVEHAGMDIFRVEDGRIVEYWLCANVLVLLQQIGVIPP